jgi:threonine/homoserine/homoserine lactone efflux protein
MDTMVALALIFGTSFLIALSGAMMPGPMLAVAISETPRRGPWTGPLLIVGHMAVEGLLVIGLVLGLSVFLQSDRVVGGIGLAGGAMLVWMGQGMLRSVKKMTLDTDADNPQGIHPILAGAVTSVANPYFILWWATIGLTYIATVTKYGATGVIVFYLGHVLADFAWFSLVCFGLHRGRNYIGDRVYRTMIASCGVVLLFFGGWFFWTGMNKFIV